jgi:hypothetical protein
VWHAPCGVPERAGIVVPVDAVQEEGRRGDWKRGNGSAILSACRTTKGKRLRNSSGVWKRKLRQLAAMRELTELLSIGTCIQVAVSILEESENVVHLNNV